MYDFALLVLCNTSPLVMQNVMRSHTNNQVMCMELCEIWLLCLLFGGRDLLCIYAYDTEQL